jgi:hypothetical protein
MCKYENVINVGSVKMKLHGIGNFFKILSYGFTDMNSFSVHPWLFKNGFWGKL